MSQILCTILYTQGSKEAEVPRNTKELDVLMAVLLH